ncbi:MAG: hypothetical protein IPK87_07270 [Planctomycetes bacterium]|nr:hypothetical protein [Planctomycetota bacterium]
MTLILNPPQRSPRKPAVDPHREAKARLHAAMAPDLSVKRVGRDGRILFGIVPLLLVPFGAAALLAVFQPVWPGDVSDWRGWIDPGAWALVGVAAALAFYIGVSRVMSRWANSAPDSPEKAIHEFYRAATRRRLRSRRLGALVRGFDHPAPPVRPVFNWLTAAAVPKLDSAKTLARYWRALLRGNPAVTHLVTVGDLQSESPLADVALARVTLRIAVRRKFAFYAALAAGVLVAAAPFVVGAERLRDLGAPFWGVVVSAAGLGAGLAWLIARLNKAHIDRREVTVHKLLVRHGHNWRLVSGEWESIDEADLEWLLKFRA